MIGFVGLSHLGIVSSVAAASKGMDVVACDGDETICAALRQGHLPFVEPGLGDLLAKHRQRIRFTSTAAELDQCGIIYFSEDSPTNTENETDLAHIERLFEEVLPHVSPRCVLVVLSQVSPGFTRRMRERVDRESRPAEREVYCQVETLVIGDAVHRATQPERFIVGCANPREPLRDEYRGFLETFGCPILPMRCESAELTKIAINAFLASSVSTTNMLAEICEAVDADWSEIAPALRLDRRIGPRAYLNPGLGISGGNLERDLIAIRRMSQQSGTDAGLVEQWIELSRYRRDWVLRTIHSNILPHCPNPVIALWGLAYKPNTDSTRNSPTLALLPALRGFEVRLYDPAASLPATHARMARECGSALGACGQADVLVVMTPWAEFASFDLKQLLETMRGRFLVDPFGAFAGRVQEESGFSYFRLGAPAQLRQT